jgi:hypothetical protein
MVETTVDIDFAPGRPTCAIESNAAGDVEQQAELVVFGHYAARVIALLGPARAGNVVRLLTTEGDEESQRRPSGAPASKSRAVARFVDASGGPRIYFRFKSSRPHDAGPSVRVLRDELAERRSRDTSFRRRLELASELVGRLGATGQIRAENEFDVALAAADVGWRLGAVGDVERDQTELECPACGNTQADDGFDLRIWPSEEAALRKCVRCAAGVWKRSGHGARLLRPDIWGAMESMRWELGAVGVSEPGGDPSGVPLLQELKRAFAENGWPYSEVSGAPVLLADLSGPAGRWNFYVQAVEEKALILLYSIVPERVPEPRRREVSEFLTRANYGLAAGNFELDFDDGEVRYKSVLHLQGDELDGLTLKRLVRANGVAMETYLPSIAKLIESARSPAGGDVAEKSALKSTSVRDTVK